MISYTLPAYSDGELRPKRDWTDATAGRVDAIRRRLLLEEFMVDVSRARFVRWLYWRGEYDDDAE